MPGQFSEWSDGQTLVNHGMRLSPWEAPRFLWAAIEGLAGLRLARDTITLDPQLPPDWQWLRLSNLPYWGRSLSFFIIRRGDGLHAYTPNVFGGDLPQHHYRRELPQDVEAITTGLSLTALERKGEVLVCLRQYPRPAIVGPFLAHRALAPGWCYRTSRLARIDTGMEGSWAARGKDLQRLVARIEPRSYAFTGLNATGARPRRVPRRKTQPEALSPGAAR